MWQARCGCLAHTDSLNVARGDMSLVELSALIGVFEKAWSVHTQDVLSVLIASSRHVEIQGAMRA